MAYYARKEGLAHYRFARTRKDCNCFVCGDFIRRGQFRYADGLLSLCGRCATCWEKEGGRLGDISRASVNYRNEKK